MKISEQEVSRILAVSPTGRGRTRTALTPPETGTSSNSPAATVAISPTARDIYQAKKALDQVPDVREDRVQALKAQVENGTYHVSGEDIADLMIRRALADNTAL